MNDTIKNSLPQKEEIWYLAVRQLDFWIMPEDREPYQPGSILVFNLDQGLVLAIEVTEPNPRPDQIQEVFMQAVENPSPSIPAQPHRPTHLYLENPDTLPFLKPITDAFDIKISYHPIPEAIDDLVADFSGHLSEKTNRAMPGLLSQEGVTPLLVRDLFKAAAKFYLAAPWTYLDNFQALAVQVPADERTHVVAILGFSGMEYGLNIFSSWDDFQTFVLSADSHEKLPRGGLLTMYFDDTGFLPPADLGDIKRFNWQVINKQSYPIPLILNTDDIFVRPDRQELHLLEVVLRAIPPFVEDHLEADQQGDYLSAQAVIPITTQEGKKEVMVSYPAGQLHLGERPSYSPDLDSGAELGLDLPIPDRRAMEGMHRLFSAGFDDQDLNRAQDLMYDAWDETNPAKRLALAHKALSISPYCADAYVLLAEEEASTYEEELELYLKGVEAGEQALGEEYFEENQGHFWGLMITRPYMRARAGLAGILRDLGQYQEALAHFREMLRLNPGDNQGIRYLLLHLLMELNRLEEADALLEDYQGDWSVEWLYTRALRLFQEQAPPKKSAKALAEAINYNSHVPAYLLGQKRIPRQPPAFITSGGEDEAVSFSAAFLSVWRKTAGALDWLRDQLDQKQRR